MCSKKWEEWEAEYFFCIFSSDQASLGHKSQHSYVQPDSKLSTHVDIIPSHIVISIFSIIFSCAILYQMYSLWTYPSSVPGLCNIMSCSTTADGSIKFSVQYRRKKYLCNSKDKKVQKRELPINKTFNHQTHFWI